MNTSTKSWHEFRNSEQQQQSYAAVIKVLSTKMTPMTGREICDAAGQEGLWKRLSEMEKVGWVVRVGKRTCTVTGKTANIWRLKTAAEVAAEPPYEGQSIEIPDLYEPEKYPRTILDEVVS